MVQTRRTQGPGPRPSPIQAGLPDPEKLLRKPRKGGRSKKSSVKDPAGERRSVRGKGKAKSGGEPGGRSKYPDGDTSPDTEGTTWRNVRVLGSGGEAVAFLQVKVNEQDGNIVDQRVARVFRAAEEGENPNHANPDMHWRLCSAGPELFVKMFWHERDQKGAEVTYMEWCSGGDLFNVLTHYYKNPAFNEGKGERLPELFIWWVFLRLLEAALVMWQGGVNEPKDAWKDDELIHSDLRSANVFLKWGAESGASGFSFPDPVLGDLDCVKSRQELRDSRDKLCPKHGHNLCACEAWSADFGVAAPELHDGHEPSWVSRHTHVWMIGRIIRAMIDPTLLGLMYKHNDKKCGKVFCEALFWGDGLNHDVKGQKTITIDNPHDYSDELIESTKCCLAINFLDRTQLEELHASVAKSWDKKKGELEMGGLGIYNIPDDPEWDEMLMEADGCRSLEHLKFRSLYGEGNFKEALDHWGDKNMPSDIPSPTKLPERGNTLF